MKRPIRRGWTVVLAIWLAAMACNLQYVSPQERAARTATAEMEAYWLQQTQTWLGVCGPPQVLASLYGSSVFAGPGFAYGFVGLLSGGQSAFITGKDAEGIWWQIEFAAGPGGRGWTLAENITGHCLTEEIPVVATPSPPATACQPTATANQNANVRVGPSTLYAVIGSLLLGQSATIAGKNADGTWWYIEYADGPGGHGWIAASTVTAACVQGTIAVITPPPLPATDTPSPVGQPDLIVSEFTISPESPTSGVAAHVRIGVYNQGGAATGGSYVVRWYGLSTYSDASCSWVVPSTKPQGGRILECDFAFPSWYPHDKTSLVVVDADNEISESNEGNNEGTISPFGVDPPLT